MMSFNEEVVVSIVVVVNEALNSFRFRTIKYVDAEQTEVWKCYLQNILNLGSFNTCTQLFFYLRNKGLELVDSPSRLPYLPGTDKIF